MSEILGFTADPSVGVTDEFLIGLQLADPESVTLAGEGLPYFVDGVPYIALLTIEGVKGSTTKMPHPSFIAETLAGIETPTGELEAAEYIVATNPVRRGVRMQPTRDTIRYVEKVKEALTAAEIKFDDYPWALLFGTTPVGEVKAQIGESFAVSSPLLVGVAGGHLPMTADATVVPAEQPVEQPAEEVAEMSTITLAEVPVSSETAAWEGLIAVEGVETGDGRFLAQDALTWRELPLPIMSMTENPVGGSGHDGAVLVGRIDSLERRGQEVWATGVIDLGSENGREAHRLLQNKMMRGVSADIDKVEWEVDESADPLDQLLGDSGGQRVAKGRLMGATLTSFPALAECEVWLSGDSPSYERATAGREAGGESVDESALAASGGFPTRIVFHTPLSDTGALVASAGAGVYPVNPPAEWMDDPKFDGPSSMTVSSDGRVKGHVALFGACHIGFGQRCVEVPRSSTNYAGFLTGTVLSAEGTTIKTGQLIVDTVHPDLKLAASDAQSFYAHTGCAVADLVVGEDQFGIWVAGAMRHTADEGDARIVRGSDASPDWRNLVHNGKRFPREMCALLAVNNSGFKALVASASNVEDFVEPGRNAAYISDGEVLALVASAQISKTAVVDGLFEEVAGLRVEFSRLRDQLRPQIVESARTKAQELAASTEQRPKVRSESMMELDAARRQLARAKAKRLALS